MFDLNVITINNTPKGCWEYINQNKLQVSQIRKINQLVSIFFEEKENIYSQNIKIFLIFGLWWSVCYIEGVIPVFCAIWVGERIYAPVINYLRPKEDNICESITRIC